MPKSWHDRWGEGPRESESGGSTEMMSTAHALDYKMEARGKSGAAGRGGMWRREIYGKRKLERRAGGGGALGVEGWVGWRVCGGGGAFSDCAAFAEAGTRRWSGSHPSSPPRASTSTLRIHHSHLGLWELRATQCPSVHFITSTTITIQQSLPFLVISQTACTSED